MQFLSTIVLLAATAAATAIPALRSDYSDYTVAQTGESHVSAVEGIVEKRQNARFALYACNARDFNDHEGCTRLWAGRDTCQNMPPGYVDSVSSIGPDAGVTCHLFDNLDCKEDQGGIYNVVSPGFNNLAWIQHPPYPSWEDHIASYRCWW